MSKVMLVTMSSSVMVAHLGCGFDPHLLSKQTFERQTNFGNRSFEDYCLNKNLKETVGALPVKGKGEQTLRKADRWEETSDNEKVRWQHGTRRLIFLTMNK